MSIRKPKDKKFLYIAFALVLLGIFDLYMLLFVLGKPNSNIGGMIMMLFVNAIGFGILGLTLFGIVVARAWRARILRWQNIIREATRGNGFQNNSVPTQNLEPVSKQPVDEDYLKFLYKEILKKYHPDFAQSEEDKRFRSELTAKISEAYKNKDIEKLKLFK
jgi:hypothetical protein